ncbi:MAG: hypothetical protein CMH12_08850 [Maritimibacter sp.]|nr:hypothetical protein [Maritimibacter sp.]
MITRIREASQSLTFRIAALLALALLPIGLISVATTFQLLSQADRKAETNLMALTAEAAAPEAAFIRTGIGAANMLASMIPQLRDGGWNCGEQLNNFIEQSDGFSFAGYIALDGTIACASGGQGENTSSRKIYRDMTDDPRTRITVVRDAMVSRTSVVMIAVPVIEDGLYNGYVIVSLPHGKLFRPLDQLSADRPLDLITYNNDAEVLTSSRGLDDVEPHLPEHYDLADLRYAKEGAFIDQTRDGLLRVFAVIPVVPGQVYALGSWEHSRNDFIEGLSVTSSMLFPVAMWLVCLGVAFFAVQRMVIRPTRNLRARMLQFMRSRRITEPRHESATPRELREMEETWMRLAKNVLHDEAELYDTIHQRTVLLKEVHHRVKNNLQLIVSILNMKVRKARDPEVRSALTDIRQRVMGIARVHQELYETSTAERVHAGELLKAIVGHTISSVIDDESSIDFEEGYDDIVVYPDQAVPLSLAVTELLTNALKHLGAPSEGEKPVLTIHLRREGTDDAEVMICNSLSAHTPDGDAPQGSGLGMALVTAFAHQLEGNATNESTPEQFCSVLRFPVADFDDTDVPSELEWSN